MWFPVGGQQEKYRINGGLALGGNITLLSWFIFLFFTRMKIFPVKKNTFLLFKIKVFNLKFQNLKIN